MISMKKTGEMRSFDGINLYRVESTKNIPQYSVEKGDVGGWVCQASFFEGDCWVADSCIVMNSSVHSSCITSDSYIFDSTILNSRIFNSGITNSTATQLDLTKSKMIDSKLTSLFHQKNKDCQAILFDVRNTQLKGCTVHSTEETPNIAPSIFLRNVEMNDCNIEGKDIRIFECGNKFPVNSLHILGRDIRIESIEEIKEVFIGGKEIFIGKLRKLTDTSVGSQSLDWDGDDRSCIADTQIECKQGLIRGEMIWNKVRFDCENLRIETGVESEKITLSNTSFWKNTVITGNHIVDKSAFSHGIQLSGQSNMKDVLSTIGKPVLSGEVTIEHASLKGKGIKISDYAKVLGVSGQRVVIRAFVHVSELAFISNQASGSPLVIKGMNVNSDTKITA